MPVRNGTVVAARQRTMLQFSTDWELRPRVRARLDTAPTRSLADRHPTLLQSLEKLPVALMVFRSVRDDFDDIIDFEWEYANPASEEMIGRTDEDLRGKRLLVEMPGNREAGLFKRYVSVVETGISDSHEFRYAYEDLDIWFSSWASKVGDGFAVTFTEVTEARTLRLKLVHQASLLRSMYEQAPFAACVAGGARYVFEFTNEAFDDLVGRGELVGSPVDQEFPRDEGAELRQILEHVRATRLPYSAAEYQLGRTVDGEPRYFRVLAKPLDSEDIGPPSVQLVAVDVTELVTSRLRAEELAWQLAEEEELYRATFNDAPVGIAHIGLDERFLTVNDRLSTLLGREEDELLSMKFDDLVIEEYHGALTSLLRQAQARKRFDCQYRCADGRTMWATTTISVLRGRDGRAKHFVAVVEDVSSLVDAKRRLEESNRHKDDFLAVLGHELRNPLAALRSAAAVFSELTVEDEKLAAIRRTLERQTRHMGRLIDDLLDVGRISRGKLNIIRERVDLRDAVVQTIEELGALRTPVPSFDADLGDEPIIVSGDRARLMQVCQNLLHNAFKYTPDDGKVTLSLSSSGGEARLTVEDTGVGLDPAFARRIFLPFEQEPQDLSRSQGGLGLGLSLSHHIMRLHGGSIEVTSPGRGCGSRFVVRLPVSDEGFDDSFARESTSSRPRHLHFLIIEDNVDAAELLGMLLEGDGHAVSHCHDGNQAMSAIEATRPQVVLCDIGLPGVSGYEIARTVRAHANFGQLVMIALSGYGRSEDKLEARKAGFDGHLTKPAEVQAIYSILRPLSARLQVAES